MYFQHSISIYSADSNEAVFACIYILKHTSKRQTILLVLLCILLTNQKLESLLLLMYIKLEQHLQKYHFYRSCVNISPN